MSNGQPFTGKGSRSRVTDNKRFEDNFGKAFENQYIPPWKRRLMEQEAAEKGAKD